MAADGVFVQGELMNLSEQCVSVMPANCIILPTASLAETEQFLFGRLRRTRGRLRSIYEKSGRRS